jgi:hypothetical protein
MLGTSLWLQLLAHSIPDSAPVILYAYKIEFSTVLKGLLEPSQNKARPYLKPYWNERGCLYFEEERG